MHRGTPGQANGTPCIASISSPSMTVAPFPNIFDRHQPGSPCYNRISITVTALWVATPLLSTVSVAAVCVAVSTNQWLLTQENIKNENYTGRGDHEYYPKDTVSGLWTLCYTIPGKHQFICSNIEYFPKEEYSPDLKDSTMAIPYTVTKSAAFFILSTVLLFVGEVCCLYGHFSRQKRLLTFISGVIFIISGLLMLIGLVMYISIFKAEIGGKLRATSQLQPAVFTYKYGYSFILYVTGFVSTEISGTCAVFLYIYWHQKDWRKKGYALRAKFVSPTSMCDADTVDSLNPFCRRHPSYLSSNSIGCSGSDGIAENFTPVSQSRLFLNCNHPVMYNNEYPPPVCLRHSLSCSVFDQLLTDVAREKESGAVSTSDFTRGYPSLPSKLCHHHLMTTCPFGYVTQNYYPKVSTENVTSGWKDIEIDVLEDCSSDAAHDHNFVPFDLGDNVAPVPPDTLCLDKNIQDENWVYRALTKTTPV